jgi:glycerol-3-phosphate O-acyltransferase/dihydroxyacetone phosphate acyltransferase
MSTNIKVRDSLREVRERVTACVAVVMLSVDALNPVKAVCGFFGFSSWWFAVAAVGAMVSILYANFFELSYFMTKLFFYSILSIFFSSMEILGKENVPDHGPIIFTANHMNQFVDAAVMVVANAHRLQFLIAEKSFNQRIIGDLAKALGSIPVARPQDSAQKGPGKIRFEGLRLRGDGTAFTSLKKGDKLRPGRSPNAYKVKAVLSDVEAELAEELGEPSPLDEPECQTQPRPPRSKDNSTASMQSVQATVPASIQAAPADVWVAYDVLAFVDQSKVFEKVHAALAQGSCIGIFPEGGSHDNTDLLPLKVGVASIAFGVLDKFDVNVPIVPVGLNYFRGHRFRGRVVVEFGRVR